MLQIKFSGGLMCCLGMLNTPIICTMLLGERIFEESGSGYTLIWKGKDNGERRIHGVSILIKTSIYWNHQLTPTAISKWLMTIFSSFNNFMTLISAYAPTLDADEEMKNQFYQQLNELFLWTPPQDKLLLLSDFNEQVAKDQRLWNNLKLQCKQLSTPRHLHRVQPRCDKHHVSSAKLIQDNLATSKIQTLAHAGLCHRPSARLFRYLHHQSCPGCRAARLSAVPPNWIVFWLDFVGF